MKIIDPVRLVYESTDPDRLMWRTGQIVVITDAEQRFASVHVLTSGAKTGVPYITGETARELKRSTPRKTPRAVNGEAFVWRGRSRAA